MVISHSWAGVAAIAFLMSRRAIKYWCAVLTLKLFGHSIKN